MPTEIEQTDSHLPLEIRSSAIAHYIHDATGRRLITVWRPADDTRSLHRAEVIKSALEWAESLADVRESDLRVQEMPGGGE